MSLNTYENEEKIYNIKLQTKFQLVSAHVSLLRIKTSNKIKCRL